MYDKKAKDRQHESWYRGYLIPACENNRMKAFIATRPAELNNGKLYAENIVEVDPRTECTYIGIMRNETPIYTGDIVACKGRFGRVHYGYVWPLNGDIAVICLVNEKNKEECIYLPPYTIISCIGNIYDNTYEFRRTDVIRDYIRSLCIDG